MAADSAAIQPAGSERVTGPSGQGYHARAIETIRTGQCVLARNPQLAEADLPDAPVDPASWVNIHLRMAQPTGDGVQLGHLSQAPADLGLELDEPEQFVRPMEAEDQPAAGVRLEGVGELGELAGGLVGEGERQAIGRQGPRQAVERLARLRFDPGQGVPLRLRLDVNRSTVSTTSLSTSESRSGTSSRVPLGTTTRRAVSVPGTGRILTAAKGG
jgi:hypothetical protein